MSLVLLISFTLIFSVTREWTHFSDCCLLFLILFPLFIIHSSLFTCLSIYTIRHFHIHSKKNWIILFHIKNLFTLNMMWKCLKIIHVHVVACSLFIIYITAYWLLLYLFVSISFLHSSAWLSGYEHSTIEKINQRIEDVTGLEMDTAEELQVRGAFTWSANKMLLVWWHMHVTIHPL